MSNLTPAENLAQAIHQVACKAHTEEDLCAGVEQALSATLQDAPIHTRLAALSQQAHQLAVAGDEAGLTAVEAEVDEAAAELWGITDRELREIDGRWRSWGEGLDHEGHEKKTRKARKTRILIEEVN